MFMSCFLMNDQRERDGKEELMIYLGFVIWCWQVAYI